MAQKKKTAYQQAIENEEGSGGSGNTTTANRPKSREKRVTGEGKPIKSEKMPKQTIHGGYNSRPGTKKTKKGSGRKF